jgi:acyl-coenzyme A thioesterase PaaI-like protein
MTPELRSWIEQVRRSFGDRCFACGRKNDEGLHLDDWNWEGGRATAVFRPRPQHVGAGNTLHGGLATTVLDEAMVWAGILQERVLSVTGTLNLRFRRPLYVTDTITAVGWVERRSGRRLELSGRLEAGGAVAAEASGLYLVSSTVD